MKNVREILLTNGGVTLVDEDAFWWLITRNWRHTRNGYVQGTLDGKEVYLHRLVTGFPDGEVDHKNRNRLDNRRENLRVVTHTQNARNRSNTDKRNKSGFKGVSWHKRAAKWVSQITVNGENVYLGLHADPVSAARAYDVAALSHFGEFAHINFDGETFNGRR